MISYFKLVKKTNSGVLLGNRRVAALQRRLHHQMQTELAQNGRLRVAAAIRLQQVGRLLQQGLCQPQKLRRLCFGVRF